MKVSSIKKPFTFTSRQILPSIDILRQILPSIDILFQTMADSKPATRHLIAMYQGNLKEGKQQQLAEMEKQMGRAAAVKAELIVFPELFLLGYQPKVKDIQAAAEKRDGPSFQRLSGIAKKLNIAVLYGYPEVDAQSGRAVYYNSAQLIDNDGKSLVNYRKLHLWNEPKDDVYNSSIVDPYESELFTPGKEFAPVVECCGMKIGILICFDVEFPESVRTLALRGAQLVAVPTATLMHHEYKSLNRQLIPTRARENRIHVAYTNLCDGKTFPGYSACCNPEGDAVGTGGPHESLILAVVVPDGYKYLHGYLHDRRPSIYNELTKEQPK